MEAVKRIFAGALAVLLLSGCIRQAADTPDTPDTSAPPETTAADTTVSPEPKPEIPERYTGDLASATGLTYTLVDLSDALAEVGFTQRNFQSLYKHCTPLGQGRWAIRYVTDDTTYTERTAVIYPDGTVYGVMEDGKNTMTMALYFQSTFVLTSAKSGTEIKLNGYLREDFDRMLYAEELTPGEFFAIRGYPRGDDTPELDLIRDIPCALYNQTERLTEFKYRSICKVDGGFEAFYPLENGGLACELLDEKGQVIGPVESPVYPYDAPYNNYRKGYETVVQWDPLSYSKTGLAGCGLATSGGRPLTEAVFQDCTVAVDGTALVMQGSPLSETLSLLIVTGAEYAEPPTPLCTDLSAVTSITYSLTKLENPTRFLPGDYGMSPNMPAPLSDETHHFPAGDGNWYYSCYGQHVRLDSSTYGRIPKAMTLVRPDGSMPTLEQYRVWQKDILDENGTVIATEEANMREDEAILRARYPETKPVIRYDGLTPVQDPATGLYYYANAAGDPVCAPAFTECTNVKDGTALVKINYNVYTLVVESVS